MTETYMFFLSERDASNFLATMGALFSGMHGDSHAAGIYSHAMKGLFSMREYRDEDLPEPDWTPDPEEHEPREDKKRDRERRSARRSKQLGWV